MKKWVKLPDPFVNNSLSWEEWKPSVNNKKSDGTIMSYDEQWEAAKFLFETCESEVHPDLKIVESFDIIEKIIAEEFEESDEVSKDNDVT